MPVQKKIPIVKVNSPTGTRFLKQIETARLKRDDLVGRRVEEIIRDIEKRGDSALFEYSAKFDKVKVSARTVRFTPEEIKRSAAQVPPDLKKAIRESAKRIRSFHQMQGLRTFTHRSSESILKQIVRPLGRVAVYIPGGYTAYSSSVLMSVIPAQIAGVKEIVAVTPPRGELDPAIAYALSYLKVKEVYRIGGAQAIAALAYGTKSIPAVDKIVGPGNAYVATAKKLVYGKVDIDSVAGPSEVVIIADNQANPQWVAQDLLAQAEHGSGDETAVCITENASFAQKVALAVIEAINASTVKQTLQKLPAHAITIFLTGSREQSIALSNTIAPEHLQIITQTATKDLAAITNAAAVFLGPLTPVAMGDYMIGTNHVLPTNGAARFACPLGVESFQKRISVAQITASGLKKLAPMVSVFARNEQFVHHAISAECRVSGIVDATNQRRQ